MTAVKRIRFQPGLPHGLGRGDLSGTPASDYPLEVIGEGQRLAAGVFALFPSDGNTFALSLQDILTLQFCDSREYGKHEFAGWRRGVDCLLSADEFDLLFGQPFHEVEQVARVAGKAADGLDNDRIAAPDVIHHTGKLRTVSVLAAGLVDKQFVNTEVAQQDFLSRGVLLLGADTDVAASQMRYSFRL